MKTFSEFKAGREESRCPYCGHTMGAHAQRCPMANLPVQKHDNDEKAQAVQIADFIMKENPTNKDLIDRFGLSLEKADTINRSSARAFGPGGRGFDWLVRLINSILVMKDEDITLEP